MNFQKESVGRVVDRDPIAGDELIRLNFPESPGPKRRIVIVGNKAQKRKLIRKLRKEGRL